MNPTGKPTEHILACLSSSPSNAKIVRTAATMAKAFGGSFTALYVKTPDADRMNAQDKQRLQQHIHMAEQAGADITTLYGDDIPQQVAEFARISGITKIVLGRSSVNRRHFWSGPTLTEKLTQTARIWIFTSFRMQQLSRITALAEGCLPVPLSHRSVIC